MLADDAAKTVVDNWGTISLPEYLDYNRNGKGWPQPVVAWHVTTRDRLPAILRSGLHGSACASHTSSGSDRPYATYLFCARSVIEANIPVILGHNAESVIIRVTIPRKHTAKLYGDDLYNISIEQAEMSAIQYRDDIPASWLAVE